MVWDETTPLSAANLNGLETRISDALTAVSDAKTPIAAAITAMGQASTTADTFAQMAAKIEDISNDADAAVGDTRAGKTFYQGGTKKTGTLDLSLLLAANLVSGVTIDGVTGTAKRSASGNGTLSGTTLTVSGLDFTPSFAHLIIYTYSTFYTVKVISGNVDFGLNKVLLSWSSGNGYPVGTTVTASAVTNGIEFAAGGFSCDGLTSGYTYKWWAQE